MKRFMIITLGLAASVMLAACGGGATATPDLNDGGNNPLTVTATGPSGGAHTVSFIPGKLDVRFGGDPAELATSLGRFGYDVEFTNGSYASVDIGSADPQSAIEMLTKELNIFSAEQVQQVTIPATQEAEAALVRNASHTPLDPYYGDQFRGIIQDTEGAWGFTTYFGQAWPMNSMGFNGAWDISDPLGIDGQVAAQPVRIAIIDAGWYDYNELDRLGLDETILDPAASGSITGAGVFTPGLAAVEWDTFIAGTTVFYRSPYRTTGDALLGILAADHNNYKPNAFDINGDTTVGEDEIWNEGMAGINPNATYVLIKTGTPNTGDNSWTFSDQEIAASIEHAWDTADCDIILLGMFIDGSVPANVQTAITNARNNGALVVAPAGDVVDSWNGTAPGYFDDTPVDITVDPVWPAAADGCLSVTGTGYNRVGALADFGTTPNNGLGWTPAYNEPFNQMFTQLATYCNTGADIAGMGWGFGFGVSRYFVQSGVGDGSEGNPYELDLSEDFYTTSVNRFSTTYSAAYVAGAASIVFQALSFVNGVPPSDDEVETILLDTIQFPGMAGILDGGGYLNANAAAMDAIAGGTLFQYEPAMAFTTTTAMFEWFSQNRAAVTRGTDLSVSPTIVNGTAPFTLEVDWNNGEDPVEVTNWNSGDTVTLTGGYDALGLKYISLTVIDANAQTITITPDIFVINPLVATINVENGAGDILPTPPSLKTGTTYRFRPAINNLFTGDLGGTPNEVSYEWWFESDPAADPADSTNEAPTFAFASAGSHTVTFKVTESVRPDSTFTLAVNVAN